MESYIRAIFNHHKLPAVDTLAPLSGGSVNPGYYVNDAFVIRFNRRDPHLAKYRREAIAYRLLKGVVPIPDLIAVDESRTLAPSDYIILSRLKGVDLEAAMEDLPTQEVHRLTFEAGKLMARIHGVGTGTGFGRLEKATFATWDQFVEHELELHFSQIERFGVLDNREIGRIRSAFGTIRPQLAAVATPRLLHGDYWFSNLNYASGQINGVYDFEWATAGDPLFDFRDSHNTDKHSPANPQTLLEGYQSVRPLPSNASERIHFYQMMYCVELLPVAHQFWGPDDVTWLRDRINTMLAQRSPS